MVERRKHPLARALGITALGAVVPGLGLLVAGRRLLGLMVLSVFAFLVGALTYVALAGRDAAMHWLVQPDVLRVVAIALPTLGLAWVVVILATYRSLRPRHTTLAQRVLGYGLVGALVLVTIAPLGLGGRYALIQKGLVEHVFAGQDSKSATRPANASVDDPWAGRNRVNVLLLGGDGGPDRVGVRPDTLIVASIDTRTGGTVLFSLPRNLQKVPFAPGSVLADAYPHGVYTGSGDELEWMLNSIYENVPAKFPDLLRSDHPGADATKLAISGALGIPIDYYVLVNLAGFRQLVDALGGITVNVNQRVAVGGEATAGLKPHRWIARGPNQHFDGFDALWFARGRYGADDYQRMGRQRCVIEAIIDQADPLNLLRRYEALAGTSKDILVTDIPAKLLPSFVDLALKVKRAGATSIAFTNEVIRPSDPDYAKVHRMVMKALRVISRGTTDRADDTELRAACAYNAPKG